MILVPNSHKKIIDEALDRFRSETDNAINELNRTKANETDLAVERARITNLAKLKEGSTTGDAELIDAHVDDLGNTHDNIGTAFRTRSSQLSNEIGYIAGYTGYISKLKVSRNTINASGVISSSTKSLLSIPVNLEIGMIITCASGYQFRYVKDGVGAFGSWFTSRTVSNAMPDTKDNVRIHITKTDSSEITEEEASNVMTNIIYLQENAIERNANSINEIHHKISKYDPFYTSNQYDIASKSMHSDTFTVENLNSKVCISTDSEELITGNVYVIGEISNDLDYQVAFDYSQYNETGTSSYIVIELEDGTKIKAGQTNSYYWKINGTTVVSSVTKNIESLFTPVSLKGTKTTFSIVFADGHTVNYQSKAKNIYYEFTISKNMDVYIDILKSKGYTLERKCASLTLPHTPFAIHDNILAFCYYSYGDNVLTVETLDLTTKQSNTKRLENCVLIIDTHNYIDMAIDNDGYIHIMANCHYSHLYYYYGNVRDIQTISESNKLASEIATYPQFLYLNGVFYATYRELTSSSGRWKVYKYANGVFTATTGYIADGTTTSTQACPYFQRWYVGDDGYAYNAFCWRFSGDVKTNQDICFIKTNDFVNFYNYKDQLLTLPITLENLSLCKIESIPQNSGLINQRWIGAFETQGKVAVWYMKYDENGYNNIYLDYFVDKEIRTIKLTQFDYHWEIKGTLSSNVIVVDLETYGNYAVLNIRHRTCGDISVIINNKFEICKREYLLESLKQHTGIYSTINKDAKNSNVRMITEQGNTRTFNDSGDGKLIFD